MTYEKCAYCRKMRPVEEMEQSTLIYQSRDCKGKACIEKALHWYCKDTPCAMHNQMSHEG